MSNNVMKLEGKIAQNHRRTYGTRTMYVNDIYNAPQISILSKQQSELFVSLSLPAIEPNITRYFDYWKFSCSNKFGYFANVRCAFFFKLSLSLLILVSILSFQYIKWCCMVLLALTGKVICGMYLWLKRIVVRGYLEVLTIVKRKRGHFVAYRHNSTSIYIWIQYRWQWRWR